MARIEGTPGGDRIEGGRHRDVIHGLDGDDALYGGNGQDRLVGGAGDDRICGGEGADILDGGHGRDKFLYTTARDSDPLRGDVILDFHQGRDTLLFRGELREAGNLHFIGTDEFSGVPGEVRYEAAGGGSGVFVDVDGDQSADLVIGFVGDIFFQASDFSF